MIDIEIINDYKSNLVINNSKIKFLFKKVLNEEKINAAELSLILSNRPYLNKLKKKYFKQDHYTDVIAFNLNNENEDIVGEIYVSIDDVESNSKFFNISFDNEFCRVIIHGLLHIIGYEDNTIIKKKEMTELENIYMLLIKENLIKL